MSGGTVIVFPSTHLSLKVEEAFIREKIPHRLVMRPRAISGECGLAIRIEDEEVERSRHAIQSGRLTPAVFYRKKGREWERLFQVEEAV